MATEPPWLESSGEVAVSIAEVDRRARVDLSTACKD